MMSHTITSPKTRFLNRIRKIFTYRPFEDFMLFFLRGTNYLGFWSRFIPNPMLYKFNSIRKVNRGGIKYSLDLSCMMQWYVFWDFKSKDRERLYSLVKRGDLILDIGTNIGETLLNFARLIGEEGYVYGFEPDEENHNNAIKNISLNEFKNVKVFRQAVSDKKESVRFFCVEPHNRGMNRILEPGQNDGGQFTVLETTTLDAVVQENMISRVDLMKIDIEGYEMHALKGAMETLKRFKPILFVEVGYNRLLVHNTSPNELIKLLEGIGYTVFHSVTGERITADYDFSYLGDGGIDVYATAK